LTLSKNKKLTSLFTTARYRADPWPHCQSTISFIFVSPSSPPLLFPASELTIERYFTAFAHQPANQPLRITSIEIEEITMMMIEVTRIRSEENLSNLITLLDRSTRRRQK